MDPAASLDAHIAKAQAGHLDAFEHIVRTFEGPIRAWAVAHCPPGGDADEVAQKTFIEAFRGLSRYQVGTNLRAWIFTIAEFQMRAETQRLKRLADYHQRYVPRAFADALERRAQRGDEAEQKIQLLKGCIAALEGSSRTILSLRYDEELPFEDISQRTQRSVGALRKHLFLLRAKLLECVRQKLAAEAR